MNSKKFFSEEECPNLAFVYYSKDKKSASTKNMVKTCEYLEDYFSVDCYSAMSSEGLKPFFDVKNDFNMINKGFNSWDNFNQLFVRFLFSLSVISSLNSSKYDIVYTRDIFFLIILSILPSKDFQVYYEAHEPYHITTGCPKFLETKAINFAEKIFCISEGVKRDLSFITEKDKLSIVRNCTENREKADEVKKYTNQEFTIAYTGSFKPRKGVDILVEAFGNLDLNARLILIGGDSSNLDESRLQSDKIEIKGFLSQKDLSKEMKAADLLVFTSRDNMYQRRYTCPMKLVEYLSTENIVLAADLPTVRWVAKDSINYFEPEDIKSLSNKLEDIVVNKEEYLKKTFESKNNVLEGLTYQEKAKSIFNEFENFTKQI